jgi:hypothetical protein
MNRRSFLRGAVGAIPAVYTALGTSLLADDVQHGRGLGNDGPSSGVISRQRHPDNLEFPFSTLNSFLTPNEQFYVRTHFAFPT